MSYYNRPWNYAQSLPYVKPKISQYRVRPYKQPKQVTARSWQEFLPELNNLFNCLMSLLSTLCRPTWSTSVYTAYGDFELRNKSIESLAERNPTRIIVLE